VKYLISPVGDATARLNSCRLLQPLPTLLQMRDFSKFFGFAFSSLLPLINPLGGALVFLGIVGIAPSAVYRMLARKIAISTTIFLLTIEAIGTALLKFFGISVPVMQVAGGFALAAMGWSLLN